MAPPALILASGSPYRRRLLTQAGLQFTWRAPDIDESPRPGEAPRALAARLGMEKARAIAGSVRARAPWILLGSDQVCHLDGEIFGKPGDRERAAACLRRFSGREAAFSTSLALIHSDGRCACELDDFYCSFRRLSDRDIHSYLDLDEPFDCAGAIRIEQAGATLLRQTRGRDPNSLLGLPVMLLVDLLLAWGCSVHDFRNRP